jgi:hypothetical protein
MVWSEVWRTPTSVMADNGLGFVSFWPTGPQTVNGSSRLTALSLQAVYNPPFWPVPVPVPGPGPGPQPGPWPQPSPGPVLPPADPAQFDHDPFKFILFIQDAESGAIGSLTFKAVINGTFGPWSSDVGITISPPVTTRLHLGDHFYDVTVARSAWLGLPGDPPTSISAQVRVSHNPEPSSLVLAVLAGPALGLTFRRRRGQT